MPEEAKDWVKLLLLDSLASAMTGWTSPETKRVSAAVESAFGPGEATIVAGGVASIGGAVMLNGYLTTARSICDIHQPTLCHVTPVTTPPVLSLGEREDTDGANLLASLAVAFETNVRIGAGLNYSEFRSRGWHTPGVVGPIAAALGGARLLGFDPARAEDAMGIAGSQAGGTFASFGTPTIKFHQARAAWSGLVSVLLTERDFEGPLSILTAKDGGIYSTFSDGGSPASVVEGLGEKWKMQEITVRLWPAAAALQSILTIVDENEMPEPPDIDSVVVSLSPASFEMNAKMGWGSTFEATLSARYVTAVALLRKGFWLDDLEQRKLCDADLGHFASNKIEVVRDEGLPEGGAALTVITRDGAQVSEKLEAPRGSPVRPPTWDDVAEKLGKAVPDRLGSGRGDAVIAAVANLENLRSVRELTSLLRV